MSFNINKNLNPTQKEQIYRMFFGPYLPEWRDKKGIVDNTDETISKRLGISRDMVSYYITTELDKIWLNVIRKSNRNNILHEIRTDYTHSDVSLEEVLKQDVVILSSAELELLK
jgi:hypothetical protein